MGSKQATPFPRVTVYGHGGLGAPPTRPTRTPGGAGVLIEDRGCELQLHFAGTGHDAPLLELAIRPARGQRLDPTTARQLVPLLDLFMASARAALAWDEDDFLAAVQALRKVGVRGRGLSDEFFRLIAFRYKALVAEGEPYPVKAIAEKSHVSIGAASRWLTEARRRGYVEEVGTDAR